MSDPRRHLPSASGMERIAACPGSFLLCQQVPPAERLSSKDADRGTRIHEARARGDVSGLAMSEADLVRKIAEIEQRLFLQWTDAYQIKDATVRQERREWLVVDGRRVCSAQIDFYAFSPAKQLALVIDRKSGRKEVPPPVRNLQLRTAVVILAVSRGVKAARTAIVQPFAEAQPLCEYSPEDIYRKGGAIDQIVALVRQAQDPDAKRVVGEHCGLCDARHICPEGRAQITAVERLSGLKWAAMGPSQKLALWDGCRKAEAIIQAVKENIAADLERDPNAIPGLEKKPGGTQREISDVAGVYDAMLKAGLPVTHDSFAAICSLGIGAWKEYYRRLTGQSEEAADRFINQTLAGCITHKPRKGSVERVELLTEGKP